MIGFVFMLVLAVIAVPLTVIYSGPFHFQRTLPTPPLSLSYDPTTIVAGEDGSKLSSTTFAKICALLMGVGLLWLFLYLLFTLTANPATALS